MKIKEKKHCDAGLGGGHWEYRVRELAPSEEKPEGAIALPDEAEEYDWTPECQLPAEVEGE